MTATQEIERIMEEIRRLTEELAMLQGDAISLEVEYKE